MGSLQIVKSVLSRMFSSRSSIAASNVNRTNAGQQSDTKAEKAFDDKFAAPFKRQIEQKLPTDIRSKIKRAQKLRRTDEMVQALVDSKMSFCSAGFENLSPDEDVRDYYNDIARQINLDCVVPSIFDDYITSNNVALVWSAPRPGKIAWFYNIDPSTVKYTEVFGQKTMAIKVPEQLKSLSKNVRSGKATEEEKRIFREIPKKWRDAANGNVGREVFVTLNERDGDFWLFKAHPRVRRYDGMAEPDMVAIFVDLLLREMIIEGDISLAFLVKNAIELVRAGETSSSGPYAGTKKLWATQKDFNAIKKQLQHVDKVLRLYVPHHVSIDYVFPPAEMWSPDKYLKLDERIYRWGGITKVVVEGTGGNYASGFLGVKNLVASCSMARKTIQRMLEEFYRHPSVNAKKFEKVPTVKWNEQILKDSQQLLREISWATEQGLLSNRSALQDLGRQPDVEFAYKSDELKEREAWQPTFEKSQGIVANAVIEDDSTVTITGPGKPGRPDGDSAVPPTDAVQDGEPRPSTSSDIDDEVIQAETAIKEFTQMEADFKTDEFYHIDNPNQEQFVGDIVSSKRLDNGIVLRFARKPSGSVGVKTVLIPVSMADNLPEAKKRASKFF